MKYCSVCNFSISDKQWRQVRFNLSCPNCGTPFSQYYSIGSNLHKQMVEKHNCKIRENRYGNVRYAHKFYYPPSFPEAE